MNIEISDLDTKRFNIPVAKVTDITKLKLTEVNNYCKKHEIQLLIARISTNDISFAQKMESDNYKIMDTIVYYKFNYTKKDPPHFAPYDSIKNISGNQSYACKVSEIAQQSFFGYFGHYHADNNLEKSVCDELYVDWARRSCLDIKVADAVLAKFDNDIITGFVTLKIISDNTGELILSGVSPSFQKRGVYQTLIYSGMEWLNNKGLNNIILSTQINNIAVQKVWARLGFEMDHSFYTFHKWFTNQV